MRSRAVAAETPRASRLDLDPSPGPDDRTTHTKKTTRSLARVPRRIAADHRASIVSLAAIRIIARVIASIAASEEKNARSDARASRLERTDRVARHRRTNTSCRDRSRSRDLQPYS